MTPQVHVYDDLEPLNRALADAWFKLLNAAIAERGRFTWALAGGSTPRALYQRIAQCYHKRVPWERVYVFWGDERLVPPDHEASNYRMAKEALLSHVPIPHDNVFSMAGTQSPDEAATLYERKMRAFWGRESNGFPSLDLVLLGLGEDGHTASLFPGHPVLEESQKWVAGLLGPDDHPPRERLTLTLPAINGANNVFFLVVGKGKREALNNLLNEDAAAKGYPARHVKPQGSLHWFVDQAAMDKGIKRKTS